jgi:hypothetical protein
LRSAASLLDVAGIRLEDIALVTEDDCLIEQLVCSGGFDALLLREAQESRPGRCGSPSNMRASVACESIPDLRGDVGWVRRIVDPLRSKPCITPD